MENSTHNLNIPENEGASRMEESTPEVQSQISDPTSDNPLPTHQWNSPGFANSLSSHTLHQFLSSWDYLLLDFQAKCLPHPNSAQASPERTKSSMYILMIFRNNLTDLLYFLDCLQHPDHSPAKAHCLQSLTRGYRIDKNWGRWSGLGTENLEVSWVVSCVIYLR